MSNKIEFSQSELAFLVTLLRAKEIDLDNADLPAPDELISIKSKLSAAMIKPTTTSELFGIETGGNDLQNFQIRTWKSGSNYYARIDSDISEHRHLTGKGGTPIVATADLFSQIDA